MNYNTNNDESTAIVVDNFSSFSEEGNAFGKKDLDEESVDSID
jgi:hypothetical protein